MDDGVAVLVAGGVAGAGAEEDREKEKVEEKEAGFDDE